jgi:hypothetical protein
MSYVGLGSTTTIVPFGQEGCKNKKGCVKVSGPATPEQQAANAAARGLAVRTVSHSGKEATVVRDVAQGIIDAGYTGPIPSQAQVASGGGSSLIWWLLAGGGVLAAVLLTGKRKDKGHGHAGH